MKNLLKYRIEYADFEKEQFLLTFKIKIIENIEIFNTVIVWDDRKGYKIKELDGHEKLIDFIRPILEDYIKNNISSNLKIMRNMSIQYWTDNRLSKILQTTNTKLKTESKLEPKKVKSESLEIDYSFEPIKLRSTKLALTYKSGISMYLFKKIMKNPKKYPKLLEKIIRYDKDLSGCAGLFIQSAVFKNSAMDTMLEKCNLTKKDLICLKQTDLKTNLMKKLNYLFVFHDKDDENFRR
ncbi:MAG: hypothetical protein ACOC3V_00920, partial [bacterium]